MQSYEQCLEILRNDYGPCYKIGNFMLCPEKKLIRVGHMFGTATKDCFGYFPEPSLKYDEETIVIFAGNVFLRSQFPNIDWMTVRLLSCAEGYSEFTDGKNLYRFWRGEVTMIDEYDESTYSPPSDDRPPGRLFPNEYGFGDEINDDDYVEPPIPENFKDRVAMGCGYYVSYYVLEDKFYYMDMPILEEFDIPNLRTIVSKSGFETDYVTDGEKVLYCGERGGYCSTERDGIEYVVVKGLLINGIDLDSIRVLGEDILADKNALYHGTSVVPFDKLGGFKFIIREM